MSYSVQLYSGRTYCRGICEQVGIGKGWHKRYDRGFKFCARCSLFFSQEHFYFSPKDSMKRARCLCCHQPLRSKVHNFPRNNYI